VATLLTVGAGLMINSYVRLTTLAVGTDPIDLIVADPVPRAGRFQDSADARSVMERWVEGAARDPRLTQAALTTATPLSFHTLSFERR